MIHWLKSLFRQFKQHKYRNIVFRGNIFKSEAVCITRDEYKSLMAYAKQYNIKLSQFKKFAGDISIIKEMLDDIHKISLDFPKITSEKKAIHICLESSGQDIFATTYDHVIELNKDLYNDTEYLKSEYDLAVAQHKFAANTNYRSIAMHETGHVVANLYRLDGMKITKQILKTSSAVEVLDYVEKNLSLYSAEYPDGREIISECFSAYYNKSGNAFANQFVAMCNDIIKG